MILKPSERRRWWHYVAICAAIAAGVGGFLLILLRGGTSTSSPAPTTLPRIAELVALSDQTLRSCAPDRIALDVFDSCVERYRDGLDALTLPSADAATITARHDTTSLLRACHASQLHEDVTMREWPAGCPQHGPASVADAEAQDRRFRAQYYAMLIGEDNAIRASIGAPTADLPSMLP